MIKKVGVYVNNYCRNCGKKINENEKVCSNCNAEVFNDRIDVEKKKNELEKYRYKEKVYVIVIICMYILPYFLIRFKLVNDSVSSFISPLLYLGATVLLIYAKIMMHDSIKIKVLFYTIISLVVLYVLSTILMFVTCLGLAELFNRGCS